MISLLDWNHKTRSDRRIKGQKENSTNRDTSLCSGQKSVQGIEQANQMLNQIINRLKISSTDQLLYQQ